MEAGIPLGVTFSFLIAAPMINEVALVLLYGMFGWALLTPLDYHASTSPLIQMLEKGHHGVRLAELSRESRERLYCWIDLAIAAGETLESAPFRESGPATAPPRACPGV